MPYLQLLITNVDYRRKDPVFWIDVNTTFNKYKQKQRRIPRYYSELEKLYSHLVSTIEDALIPALPICPEPRFDKEGNIVQKQWWFHISKSTTSLNNNNPLEYKIQLWLNRIANHDRAQQSEGLREFVESEFRPKTYKIIKPLSIHVSEQDMDPEFTFWSNHLNTLLNQLQHWLTQNDKLFHEHRIMANHWMELSSSFVSFGAIERDPELFVLYKSLAKGYQQTYDIQRLQALAIYETTGAEASYQIKNAESAQNAMQRRLIALSEYMSSKRHTESSSRQVERLKSSMNINRERASEAISVLKEAKRNELKCLHHYEKVDGNLRQDIEYKYKPSVSKDLKRALKDYATIMSETKTFEKGVAAPKQRLDGSGLRIAIVHTRWNYALVDQLYNKVYETLVKKYNVLPENIITDTVSGAYELPMAAKQLIELSQSQASETANDLLGSPTIERSEKKKKTGAFDAIICIGLVIKGGTAHFEYICDAVTHGIMRVQLDTGVPVMFGVLTCYNEQQAIARASTDEGFEHAQEWAAAAVEAGLRKFRKL
ncbi:hypothetical protein G6F46_002786 [Rhizopus delemar]|nr:hypothetical protein G6F55_002447 [Rhizopus delemar]KAG1551222.1 hypothetical protein G6F51_001981 [Rhizopus arrhizus]KAG1502596.1 hypothetical protein G6F54_002251 [Rhizopus delemar]KAG1516962.1 hypothetical protein G6F53_001754 [Rhizopus delemar]KAG1525980.1 hypothetical protein G6F52_002843 [Rhizopus delemar]